MALEVKHHKFNKCILNSLNYNQINEKLKSKIQEYDIQILLIQMMLVNGLNFDLLSQYIKSKEKYKK